MPEGQRAAFGERDLAAQILQSTDSSQVVETTLRTDDRVLARVTDGIYRQPGSALRELISNAYDADAARVTIRTDRPRFDRIVVEDDGLGMRPETVAHILHSIGGSAKRSSIGRELGVTSAEDAMRSPGGRLLIGKIGIGLFSVAQLTRSFQLMTKCEGDEYRTVATVILRQFSDTEEADSEVEYEAGKVNIWREPATDTAAHGTTIVLTDLHPQTKKTLQSRDFWRQVESAEDREVPEGVRTVRKAPPTFHVGWLKDDGILRGPESGPYDKLPWNKEDPPAEAFRKLVAAVENEATAGKPNARLAEILDYYLHMVWDLALAIPAPYVDSHPFDTAFGDEAYLFEVPADLVSPMRPVELTDEAPTARVALELGDAVQNDPGFRVVVDDLELTRPVSSTAMTTTQNVIRHPMYFIGSAREDFEQVPKELSGGPVEFQAYLKWAPRIVPKDHQGALVRIHGASGTLYDSTFMRYQVAELTRLQQITCEIFIVRGFEGALNIDRESFNYSHPHVVYVTQWLHATLRRLATTQKKIASDLRAQQRGRDAQRRTSKLQSVVRRVWDEEVAEEEAPTPVVLVDPAARPSTDEARVHDAYSVPRTWSATGRAVRGARQRQQAKHREEQVTAILQVLAAFDLLEDVDTASLERLAAALMEVLEAGA